MPKKSLLEVFAANVRSLRGKKKMTQSVLAQKAGVSVSYISMLERGQRSPPLETLGNIAHAFRVPPCDLLVE